MKDTKIKKTELVWTFFALYALLATFLGFCTIIILFIAISFNILDIYPWAYYLNYTMLITLSGIITLMFVGISSNDTEK